MKEDKDKIINMQEKIIINLGIALANSIRRENIEDKCPKCKMPRKSICDIECFCDSVKNGHITQKDYDKHIKRLKGEE
jgi:hypothetical protein